MLLRFNGITYCDPPKGQRTIRAVPSRKEVCAILVVTMGPIQSTIVLYWCVFPLVNENYLLNFSVIFKLYLDLIFPKIYLSNWLSGGEMLVYVYHKVHGNFHVRFATCSHKLHGNFHVSCQMFRRRKKLTEITSITDQFANRFQNWRN